MKLKLWLMPFFCFIILPILCYAVSLVIGAKTPIGTLVPAEKDKLVSTNDALRAKEVPLQLAPIGVKSAAVTEKESALSDRQILVDQTDTLKPATYSTVGPTGSDTTYVTGLNTAGTVKVNNLA